MVLFGGCILWTQLCDGKLRPWSEKLVVTFLIHFLPTCAYLPKGETSVDLHAAEDKNGSSGPKPASLKQLKRSPGNAWPIWHPCVHYESKHTRLKAVLIPL